MGVTATKKPSGSLPTMLLPQNMPAVVINRCLYFLEP